MGLFIFYIYIDDISYGIPLCLCSESFTYYDDTAVHEVVPVDHQREHAMLTLLVAAIPLLFVRMLL